MVIAFGQVIKRITVVYMHSRVRCYTCVGLIMREDRKAEEHSQSISQTHP